jgi:hypothetical protein
MDNQISRRHFLKKGIKYVLAIPPAVSIISCPIAIGGLIYGEIDSSFKKDLINHIGPPYIKKREVNGAKVTFIGVLHTNGFYQKYKETIDDIIERSDIIISEAKPGKGPQWDNDEFILNLTKKYEKTGVDVIYADPRNMRGDIASAFQLVYGYKYALKNFEKEPLTLKSITRRSLLYYLGASSFIGDVFFELTIDPDETLKYNLNDFCDIVLTSILEKKLSKEYKRITFIYGRNHVFRINYYLDNPLSRKIKQALYFPYYLISGNFYKNVFYHYHFNGSKWMIKNPVK